MLNKLTMNHWNDMENILCKATKKLKSVGIENPRMEAELLAAKTMDISKEKLLLVSYIDDEMLSKFLKFLERRLKREPISRIFGYRWFRKSIFILNSGTLDPRPDSEIILEEITKYIKASRQLKFADLGAGTGCLGISAIIDFSKSTCLGIEKSTLAKGAAIQNSYVNRVRKRYHVIPKNWAILSKKGSHNTFDAVLTNPPYIERQLIKKLEPDIAYDPIISLDGGNDGTLLLKEALRHSSMIVCNGGMVFCEIGIGQARIVKNIGKLNNLVFIKCAKDLSQIERCMIFRKKTKVNTGLFPRKGISTKNRKVSQS